MATDTAPAAPREAGLLSAAVVVAALGYFVDIYDLILFNIVRIPSLTALGVTGDALVSEGLAIINWQMAGMLIGGLAFGIVGDKKGRLQILFGSITLYSLATIANGFVADLTTYRVLRFVAGIGLAGELGAGVTLVAEVLPTRLRGYGTMLVATVGVSGAVVANVVAKLTDWRVSYFVGGALGLGLLLLRIGVRESHLFDKVRRDTVITRGDFFALFRSGDRFARYLAIILVGVPIWFANAILVALAPEFARALGVTGPVSAGDAVMLFYSGLVVGDLSSGLASQWLESRKKVVLGFVSALAVAIALYLTLGRGASPALLLGLIGLLGLASGYWAIFVTVGAEQFGTNIRATVATTVPNFVRGLVPVVTMAFQWTRPSLGLSGAAAAVGGVTLVVAFLAALRLQESFGRDMDFVEE